MPREEYHKPEIRSEAIGIGVYAGYAGGQPIAEMEPYFGLCPPCP